MKPLRKRTAVILSLSAVGAAGLAGAAVLAVPDEIAEARRGTCVSHLVGDRYRMVDSCDSPFADYAVIASLPVPESMRDTADWEEDFCEKRVDGWSTYVVVESEGEDLIICMGRANH